MSRCANCFDIIIATTNCFNLSGLFMLLSAASSPGVSAIILAALATGGDNFLSSASPPSTSPPSTSLPSSPSSPSSPPTSPPCACLIFRALDTWSCVVILSQLVGSIFLPSESSLPSGSSALLSASTASARCLLILSIRSPSFISLDPPPVFSDLFLSEIPAFQSRGGGVRSSLQKTSGSSVMNSAIQLILLFIMPPCSSIADTHFSLV